MKTIKKISGLIAVMLISIIIFQVNTSTADSRVEFEQYLQNHPFNKREKLSKAEWKKRLPKKDRPDLAWEQDFLMTLDPATKTVPKERLFEAYQYAEELRATMPVSRNANWTEHGPDNVGGRSRAIMFDPNDATNKKFWAGSVSGGLWYTNDITENSPSWVSVDGFWVNIAISTIAYDPSNTQIFYAGTGEGWGNGGAVKGSGIFKTEDGGNTWFQLASTISTDAFDFVQKIVVDANGNVFAATRPGYWWGNNGGIFKSEDGGNSWTQVLTGSTQYPKGADLEIATDGSIYASLGIHSSDGLYKSTDNGNNWTPLNYGGFPSGGHRIEIACAPSDANVLYALCADAGSGNMEAIVRSDDAGATWTTLTIPLNEDGNHFTRGQSWYDLISIVDPVDAQTVYIGGIDLHKTTDGGATWNMVSHWYGGFDLPEVHADQHAIAFRPGDSQYVVFGNDGGIHVSDDGGSSYNHRNSGYNVTQFYSVAMHPSDDENYYLSGAQDNGTQQFVNASGVVSTTEVSGGDGAFCFIDQNNPDYQISSYIYNNYYLSTDGGAEFWGITNSQSGRFINPCDYDNNANILYSAIDADSIWAISIPQDGSDITAASIGIGLGDLASHFRVSDFADNTLFIGTGSGRVFKMIESTASNPTITEITGSSFPTAYVSCIELGESEDQILVTFSNYGVSSIWESLDGGTSWIEKEGNLPDMPVRWALYNPTNRNEVLLATELGVWNSINFSDSSPNWLPSNTGLANVRTDMFQIREDNLIAAATHGRGLFTSDGFQKTPIASISTDAISVSMGLDESIEESFTISNIGEDGSVLSYQIVLDFYNLLADTLFFENFDGEGIPEGWTSSSNAVGWQFGTTSGTYFNPPPFDGNYAYTNDDANGNGSDGSVDYLIMPLLDLTNAGSATLKFSSYLPPEQFNIIQAGNVEVSTNAVDWTLLHTVLNGSNWSNIEIDLSSLVGESVYVRFHSDDNDAWAYGWAIDNVLIETTQAWLSVSPSSGALDANVPETIVASFNSAGLSEIIYTANLSVVHNTGIDTIAITMDLSETVSIAGDISIPTTFALHQNYPNPFNPITTLSYELPERAFVNITIYDMLGKKVKTLINQSQGAGYKTLKWNATNDYGKPVSAGMYVYTIQAGDYNHKRKMTLLK
ncbi:MAG: choice-of-anchor J domain-containing protein [Candidatus Marinimicrobia bacterium]|nr:choice-of-anchor J domain-containing protein [Candidatus Neomarinimicrobiota bacterium]